MAPVRDDPNLHQRVITGDELWVYGYDVETKASSSQWRMKSKEELNKIIKNDFLKCFEDWKNINTSVSINKCIISGGDYFDGDKIDIHE